MTQAARALLRKASRVMRDPTLQRWLAGRAVGKWPAAKENGLQEIPPYLAGHTVSSSTEATFDGPDLIAAAPARPLTLDLAGNALALSPGEADSAFQRRFADTESLLALHRFAWIRNAREVDLAWVGAMWSAWCARFAEPDGSWAWHPYTASERLINLLAFARIHGLPGPRATTLAVLGRHGTAIFDRLEYFGTEQTGNHLANNGRGLYLAGLALDRSDWAEAGAHILINEAKRIFLPSGVLREGSSHYHVLASEWYAESAEAAVRERRPEAAVLTEIARRAKAVIPLLHLPGGFPLIGDVSPDRSPGEVAPPAAAEDPELAAALDRDGWVRIGEVPWHCLTYLSPGGWSPMPGHGHEDAGSFELHHGTTPVLRDLGRRSYGMTGEPDIAASGHNTLTVDGLGVAPVNKPYYSDAFRRHVLATEPRLVRDAARVVLDHGGFARFKHLGMWRRTWRFEDDRVIVEDRLDGKGRHRIARHLHTTLPVSLADGRLSIGTFDVALDGHIAVRPSKRWHSYGQFESATSIEVFDEIELPWIANFTISPR